MAMNIKSLLNHPYKGQLFNKNGRPKRQKYAVFGILSTLVAGVILLAAVATLLINGSHPPSIYSDVAIRDFKRVAKLKGDSNDAFSALQGSRNSYYQATAVHWAQVSALTTLGSTLIGIVGMALVLVTLRESRRQTKAAIDAQRAWVRIKTLKAHDINFSIHDGKIQAGIRCQVEIENIGQTPARDFHYTLLCWLAPSTEAADADVQRAYAKKILKNYAVSTRGKVLFPNQISIPGENFGLGSTGKTFLGSGSSNSTIFTHNLKQDIDEHFILFISLVVQYKISSGENCITFDTYSIYDDDDFSTSSVSAYKSAERLKMSYMENCSYAD